MKVKGFNPVFNKDSEILILGSFPSVKSREYNFYYGNKHNRFWKLMEKFFNAKLLSISEKTEFLLKNKIALWDIVTECEIVGSMDKNIKNPVYAKLEMVLPPNTGAKKILCNGKLSYKLTVEYCANNNINVPIVCLPSTSPANARFNEEKWINELKK